MGKKSKRPARQARRQLQQEMKKNAPRHLARPFHLPECPYCGARCYYSETIKRISFGIWDKSWSRRACPNCSRLYRVSYFPWGILFFILWLAVMMGGNLSVIAAFSRGITPVMPVMLVITVCGLLLGWLLLPFFVRFAPAQPVAPLDDMAYKNDNPSAVPQILGKGQKKNMRSIHAKGNSSRSSNDALPPPVLRSHGQKQIRKKRPVQASSSYLSQTICGEKEEKDKEKK
ncbi:MAG TPA: hypothetical protein IAA58_00860 [Candidatus Gallacutalibacter stercoravium]|nr:hypothetical protein [Candidatus Gallacutalibacter stercoravium]